MSEALEMFVLIGRDAPGSKEKRPVLRPDHLAHLGRLHERGRVVLAGPFTDGTGSLIVIRAESLAAARALADADPYVKGGVFERMEVLPFKQVLP